MLFALPQYGLNLPLFWKLVVPLTVSNSAAFAEIFRAGILASTAVRREAGLAVGLRRGQAMRLVVLPQAARNVPPSLVSQSVGLLKDTSLGFVVSYTELLYSGQVLASYTAPADPDLPRRGADLPGGQRVAVEVRPRRCQARNGRFGGRRGRTAGCPRHLEENTPW